MTQFSDLSFIFRFLPVMCVLYYVTPYRLRMFTLSIASMIFYAAGDFRFLALLLFAVIVNSLLAEGTFRKEKSFLIVAILFNVALLVTFKILGQYVSGALFPLGISFYTFKMISYQIDLYKEEDDKRPAMIQTVSYFLMFPQIVQGPIMRFQEMRECAAIRKQAITDILPAVEEGLKYFAAGMFFKVMLADRFSMCFNEIGQIGYESISTPLAYIGAAGYSLNLYYDFWGYSLMAAGIGVMLGFPFIENFHHPYAAASVSEFYRRWHMTLGSFFKDYVYIPLGGSKEGGVKTLRNLFLVWALTGFWHGASFNFLLWGLLLFLIILSEKLLLRRLPKTLNTIISRAHVLLLIPLTWVVFAITDDKMLVSYFSRLFPFFNMPAVMNPSDYVRIVRDYAHVFIPGLLFLVPAIYDTIMKYKNKWYMTLLLYAGLWVSIYHAARSSGNPFMYVNF